MAKGVMGIFAAVLCTFCITGCTNEDNEGRKITDYKEVILTVASNKVPGVLSDGHSILSEVYAVKNGQADRWNPYGDIAGFEYEEGYEYKIKVSETTYLDYFMGDPSWTERDLLGIISKDKRDSDGLPLHLIPEYYYKNIPLPRYRYAVEADNNELIEHDLTSNPILPADYRYTYYHSEGCMKWIGIQDDSNVFGPYSIKQSSRKKCRSLTNFSLRMAEWWAAANGHFWMKTETRQAFLHTIYFSDMQAKPKVPARLRTLSFCIKT